MNVEYTGRQYEITPAVRKQVEHGLIKIRKVLGDNFDTHVVLAVEKHRHKAEITITVRDHPIVGVAEASEMMAAISEALDRIDRQAVKYKSRIRARKRSPKKKWAARIAARKSERITTIAVARTPPLRCPPWSTAFPLPCALPKLTS